MLGTVFLIRAVHVFESEPVDFGWRGDKAVAGGGAILDTAYHMIDLLCLYFGPPTEIYAKQAMIARPEVKYDTEDSAVLVFSYASGMMGSLLVSRAALPREEQITIFGTKGTLSVTRTEVNVVDKQGNILQHFTAARSWELALNSQFADFAACVQSGNVPKSSAQTHLTTMRFIEAAYSSVEHRMPVVTELS
jgi:UDP-N-acetyl-2-amino-2-deoxyglucuronate dehydrogenase